MDRVTFMGHMNVTSAMMNLCMFFSLGMVILTRRLFFRWFGILTAIVTLVINSTTGSRGGFMGLIAGIMAFVILGLFNSRIGRKFPVILTLVFLVGVVLMGYTISQMESLEILGFGRPFDILDPMATDTFAWRIESISMAMNIMHEHVAWIWGMGAGAWEYLQDIYMEYSYGKSIHNVYVNTFFQYGLIGVIFLLWLSVNVIKQIVHAYRWFPDRRTRWFINCLVAAYISVAVHGLVDLEESKAYMWFPLAATIVFLDYLKEQHKSGLPANSKI
jgi:O-antigen ligase